MPKLKSFAIWSLKSLIALLIATMVLSIATVDFSSLIRGTLSDVFEHSSLEARNSIIDRLSESCPSSDANVVNSSSMSKREGLCNGFKAGVISKKEFLLGLVASAIEGKENQQSGVPLLDSYNKAIRGLGANTGRTLIVLLALIALLYLLIRNTKEFIITVAGMLFSIGIFIMLPYAAIKSYELIAGIDTTSILSSIGESLQPEPKAVIGIVMLMILQTYNKTVVILGASFIIIGLAAKIWAKMSKRKMEAL